MFKNKHFYAAPTRLCEFNRAIIPYSKIPRGSIRYRQKKSQRERETEKRTERDAGEKDEKGARRKKKVELEDLGANNRASVPRWRVSARAVFCPVARTSKWNPVCGTKPRVLVDKLSLEERNMRVRHRLRAAVPRIRISPFLLQPRAA